MVDTIFDLNVYKILTKEIVRHRNEFFSLWRRSDDEPEAWLKRIQSCIWHCEYPTIIMEFLLFDRFVCGLNADELKSVQSVNESWTFKQLLEHFLNENIGTPYIESSNSMNDENVDKNRSIPLNVVKSEPDEIEWLQIDSFNESPDEINNIQEKSSNLGLDGEEIDEEMLIDGMKFECEDYKFEDTDSTTTDVMTNTNTVVSDEIDNDNKDLLDHSLQKKRNQSKHVGYASTSHSKQKQYACEECDKVFKNSNNLSYHKMSVHRKIRPFACEQCDKRFPSNVGLEQHMVTHTGERPYACDQCNKSFTQSGTLEYHKQNVHQKIRPHACQQCDRRFFLAKDLRAHSLTHSGERPFKCEECDQSFQKFSNLTRHKKTVHTGVRFHACEQCDKCFSSKQGLKKHMIVHKAAESFACNHCDKRYSYHYDLKIHKKNKHQEN